MGLSTTARTDFILNESIHVVTGLIPSLSGLEFCILKANFQSLSIRGGMRAKQHKQKKGRESEDSRGRQRFLIEHLMKVNGRLCICQRIGEREYCLEMRP